MEDNEQFIPNNYVTGRMESVSERLLRIGLVNESDLLLLREEIRREEIEKLKCNYVSDKYK